MTLLDSVRSLNLGVRFLLELAALGALAYWAWTTQTGALRLALAVGLPLVAAALWATFRVAGDERGAKPLGQSSGRSPRDGGDPIVPVPGMARLGLELLLFGVAVFLLSRTDQSLAARALGFVVVLHYAVAYDRVLWLLTGDGATV